MKDFFEKLSSYNIFNYLLPGVLFAFFTEQLTQIKLIQDDILIGVFLYYFIGLIISRVGSIFIEPVLKSSGFLKFADYDDFIKASKNDEKINVLSETNNMYRTLISMFLLLILIKIYSYFLCLFPQIIEWSLLFLIVLLFFMFLFAYRKQTKYIVKRIKSELK